MGRRVEGEIRVGGDSIEGRDCGKGRGNDAGGVCWMGEKGCRSVFSFLYFRFMKDIFYSFLRGSARVAIAVLCVCVCFFFGNSILSMFFSQVHSMEAIPKTPSREHARAR